MLTDRATVQTLLRKNNLGARTSAGQHFLLDASVVESAVTAAGVKTSDTVLEIGPGLGALTEVLVKRAGRVVAIEQDRGLAALLPQTLEEPKNLTVITGDALQVHLSEHVQDGEYKLVANLPYQITSVVLRQFLSQSPRPSVLVLLIQREVADRLSGLHDNRSLLTVLAELTSTTEIIQLVDRSAFFPAPAVTSALVKLTVHFPIPSDLEAIMQVARLGFAGRRKQLKNSVASGLHRTALEIAALLEKAKISPTTRPQTLRVADWRRLHTVLIDATH